MIHAKDGSTQEVPLTLRIDTPIEVDYYRHGGILPYVLRQLIEQDTVRQTAELLDSFRPVHAAANGSAPDQARQPQGKRRQGRARTRRTTTSPSSTKATTTRPPSRPPPSPSDTDRTGKGGAFALSFPTWEISRMVLSQLWRLFHFWNCLQDQ